jgi:D-glycero-alpha-D-manno-heptose-7-phosphate kinase
MILVRAPLRISFVGGGTDIADFYKTYPGRVVSTSIDKYVYLVINPTPLINKVSARYSQSETVNHPSKLEHTRIRAALLNLGITKNIEIGSFASLPAKTGLGSSSAFSVALMKGLHAYKGRRLSAGKTAEEAARLEIDLLKEPIGKQDQYASAVGGLNFLQFNKDGSVDVEPIMLDYKKRSAFNQSMILFYTGLTRNAGDVLSHQKKGMYDKLETYKTMSDSALVFRDKLLTGDIKGLGEMLHEGWMRKKELSGKISSGTLDELYEAGMRGGAWGGKVLGAGGGGCLLFMASPEKHKAILAGLKKVAKKANLEDSQYIPFVFTDSGADILMHISRNV